MSTASLQFRHRSAIRQGGIALVVALIFLVILTLLGITALGNNTLQTRMTYGASEANLAFQASETALSAGENWLVAQTALPVTGCAGAGPCNNNAANAAFIWPRARTGTPLVSKTQFFDETWWTTNGRRFGWLYSEGTAPEAVGAQPITDTSDTPRYVIEELGPDITGSLVQGQGRSYQIYNYQVTARSFGAQPTTRTIVQSVFAHGY
ncbi:MAG: hypothetical protein NVS9B10_03050 [Nevskia sp.]